MRDNEKSPYDLSSKSSFNNNIDQGSNRGGDKKKNCNLNVCCRKAKTDAMAVNLSKEKGEVLIN